MERKFFECSKAGIKELEKEYPECQYVLTVVRDNKICITIGDDLTEEEIKEYSLL